MICGVEEAGDNRREGDARAKIRGTVERRPPARKRRFEAAVRTEISIVAADAGRASLILNPIQSVILPP